MEFGKGEPQATAALRSGMSENTARLYRAGPLPSQRRQSKLTTREGVVARSPRPAS